MGIIKTALTAPWKSNDGTEVIMGVLSWGVALVGAGLLLFSFYWGADSLFRDQKEGSGVVIGRDYSPPTTTYSTQYVGDVPVMTPVTYDETFYLKVAIAGRKTSVGVDRETYGWPEGAAVNCKYHTGRISGEIYIDELKLSR